METTTSRFITSPQRCEVVYDGMITDWLAWLLDRGHLVNGESAVAAATESWKRTVPLEEGFEGELNTL